MIARELSHVLLVAGGLAAILAVAEGLRRAGQRTEITRKLVHVASGLVGAAFPWLFDSPWSVVALAGGYAALMLWTLRTRRLASVHAARRHSSGGLYYPLAVAVVFALARERPEVYVASILVLAFGDAAAALVGRAVGRHRYRAPGGRKSLEGSLAFFVFALPGVAGPLLVLTPLPDSAVWAWSGFVAGLACLLEALAPPGSDNLVVPLGCCCVLLQIHALPPPPLWLRLAPAALVAARVLAGRPWARRPRRHRSASW